MSISFATNLRSLKTAIDLKETSSKLGTVYERLTSGIRINKASDDPAGISLAQQLNTQSRLMSVAIRNANDGLAYTSLADSGLGEIAYILGRMSELALQSSNATYTNIQRSAMQTEFGALGSEVGRISSTSSFNGIPTLSGTSNVVVQVGTGSDESSRFTIHSAMGTLSFLGLGNSYALTYSISGTTEDYAISASQKAFSAIANALDDVTRQRGIVGAAASRLSSALSYLAVARENTQAAESNLRDSDVAADTAELVRLQVLQQAQISLIAQANQEPTLALKLLT